MTEEVVPQLKGRCPGCRLGTPRRARAVGTVAARAVRCVWRLKVVVTRNGCRAATRRLVAMILKFCSISHLCAHDTFLEKMLDVLRSENGRI